MSEKPEIVKNFLSERSYKFKNFLFINLFVIVQDVKLLVNRGIVKVKSVNVMKDIMAKIAIWVGYCSFLFIYCLFFLFFYVH